MNNNTNRNYYIDLFRGIAFFLMVLDHLIYNIGELFSYYWYKYFPDGSYLRTLVDLARNYRFTDVSNIIRIAFISFIFLFISGVSSILSRNIFKRGFRLFIIAILLSVITYIISIIIGSANIIIYFGILHCISVSMMLTPIFKRLNKVLLFIIALIIIGVSFKVTNLRVNTVLLIPFNIRPNNFVSGDYYPLVPFISFYILGFILGNWYFNIKKYPKATKKYNVNVFTYFGKNTLIWYFAHQVILVMFLALFTLINILLL